MTAGRVDSLITCHMKLLAFLRNWTLPIAILTGIAAYFLYVSIPFFDSTHVIVGRAIAIVQPALIFAMLFLTFLSIGPHDLRLRRWHLWHVAIQIGLFALMAGVTAMTADPEWSVIAECAMLCLLCPTATAAAVVTRKLDGNPADITAYTMIINLAVAITAPLLLPIAHPHPDSDFWRMFAMIISRVFPLLIAPLAVAWAVRRRLPALAAWLRSFPDLPFYIWAVSLALAIAVTVKAIVHTPISPLCAVGMTVVTLICCLVQFRLGRLIGRRYGRPIEGGQALGQKNTVLIIWLGYTFLTPVSAVAGGLYSLWHNIYNSWQLYRHRRR